MDMINMKINGMDIQVPANYTILQAAEQAGIRIPTLCYLKDVNAIGACRVCVVEVKGARSNPVACLQQVAEGMEVQTNTPKLRDSRKKTLELLLSNHRMDCLGCVRSTNCELDPSPRVEAHPPEARAVLQGRPPRWASEPCCAHVPSRVAS